MRMTINGWRSMLTMEDYMEAREVFKAWALSAKLEVNFLCNPPQKFPVFGKLAIVDNTPTYVNVDATYLTPEEVNIMASALKLVELEAIVETSS